MGLISRFGNWIDYIAAPKALESSLDGINSRLDVLEKSDVLATYDEKIQRLSVALEKVFNDNLKLRDELNAIKALYKIGGTQPPRQAFDGSKAWER